MKKRAYLAFKTQCVLHAYTNTLPEKIAAGMDIAAITAEIGDGKEVTADLQKELERLCVSDTTNADGTVSDPSSTLDTRGDAIPISNASVHPISTMPGASVNPAPSRESKGNNSNNTMAASAKNTTTVVRKSTTVVSNIGGSSNTSCNHTNTTSLNALPANTMLQHNSPSSVEDHMKRTASGELHAHLSASDRKLTTKALPAVLPSATGNLKDGKPVLVNPDSDTLPTVFVMDLPGVLAPYGALSLLREQKLQALPGFCSDTISKLEECIQIHPPLPDSQQSSGPSEWANGVRAGECSNTSINGSGKPRARSMARSTSFFSLTPFSLPGLERTQKEGINSKSNPLQRVQQFHDIILMAAQADSGVEAAYAKAKKEDFKSMPTNTLLASVLVEHFSELIRSAPIGAAVPPKSSYIRELEGLLLWHMCKRTGLSTKVFDDVKEFLDSVSTSGAGDISELYSKNSRVSGSEEHVKAFENISKERKSSVMPSKKSVLEGRKCILVLYSSLVEDELKVFLSNTNLGDLTRYFAVYIHTSFAGSKLLPRSYSKIRTHLTEVLNTREFHLVFVTPNLTEASGAETSGDVDLTFLSLRPGNEWIPLDTFVAVSIPFLVSLKQISHPDVPTDFEALAKEAKWKPS